MKTLFLLIFVLMGHALVSAVEVKKAKVGQVELAYYTKGQGYPLVMIMGYRGTMSMWDPALLEQLGKRYQLILFDNRGAGLSTDTQDNRTTIAQMADDTAGLVRALGYQKAYVLGWSMGARIAQQLAVRHPELTAKLILCAPTAGGKYQVAPSDRIARLLNTPGNKSKEAQMALLFPDTPEGIEKGKAYFDRIEKAIKEGKVPDDRNVSEETTQRQLNARTTLWNADEENYKALANLKMPTLVADGREDLIDPPENTRIVAERIPFAWTAYFEGGHGFLFQDHDRFAQLLAAFLE